MSFATVDDVAGRYGRPLTDAQATSAEFLLEAATAVIADAASKDDAWAAALDPVPQMLRFVAVELAVRTLDNPGALRSFQEQLGVHSRSESYRDAAAGGGLMLTEVEVRLVRRIVYGRTTASVKTASLADEVYDALYGS